MPASRDALAGSRLLMKYVEVVHTAGEHLDSLACECAGVQ